MSIKVDGLAELATEKELPVGEWFEIRIRFKRNADNSVDTIWLPTILRLPASEVEVMQQKGGLLS